MQGLFSVSTWNEKPPSKVKLPPGRIQQSVDRLAKTHEPPAPLPPLVPRKTIPRDQVDASVHRLYDNAVDQQKKRSAEAEVHLPKLAKAVVMTNDDLQTTFARLHDASMQRKEETRKRLRAKYCPPKAPEGRLDKDTMDGCTSRLYNKCMEDSQAKQQALYDKYVAATERPRIKLSADKIKESADRLCQKKS
eukprot:PhM_4_TR5413/c1_g1_i1/m.14284